MPDQFDISRSAGGAEPPREAVAARPLRPGAGQQRRRRPEQRDPRQPLVPFEQLIDAISSEQLVAAVAGERDGDVRSRQRGDGGGGEDRVVGERLVEVAEHGDRLCRRGTAHHQLVVGGAEQLGDGERGVGVGAIAALHPHREGMERPGRVPQRQRHHGAGVEAAGEEGAERDVGDQPQPHRLVEQRGDLLFPGGGRALVRRPAVVGQRQVPVARDRDVPAGEAERAARREALDPAVDGPRPRQVAEREVLHQPHRVGLGRGQHPQQRLQLAGEVETRALAGPEERLLPEAVAGEEQPAFARVPEREGEHPAQPGDERGPARSAAREQHFGVRVGAERVRPGQLVPERGEVVDLAVEDDGAAAVGGGHRLVAADEVDDRQPAEAERAAGGVGEESGGVGPAVADRVSHHRGDRAQAWVCDLGDDAGDPAHG